MNFKKSFNLLMVLVMLTTSLVVFQPAEAQGNGSARQSPIADAEYVSNEVVVVFADSQDKTLVGKIEQAVETANETGGEVTRLSLDGSAVIQVDGDVAAAAAELSQQPDVLYAEPNYVFSVPVEEASGEEGYKVNSEYVLRHVVPSASSNWKSVMAVPKSTIQGMSAMGVYPTDPYLAENQGWNWVGADIVWPNTTVSANVCVVDTGIDAAHPDLTQKISRKVKRRRKYVTVVTTVSRVLQGYDFVDADAVAEDQNGHGTHVAGIISATQNNAVGMAGLSTGNVVSVRAMDPQGMGTTFDIAQAIAYCAKRADVRVINLSLGGPAESDLIHDALLFATTPTNATVPLDAGAYAGLPGKGKLVVAAAGNEDTDAMVYPAAYAVSPDFPADSILSVGATGGPVGLTINYDCRWPESNFGSWVNVVAPGNDIFSLTPWDKPFYKNYFGGINTRYDYMDGTSMAAAFVSAAAARRMGYKPLETSQQIGADVKSTGRAVDSSCADPTAWPAENFGTKQVNVAMLLERAAIEVSAFDASSGTPLHNATVSAYGGAIKYGSSILPADVLVAGPLGDVDPNRIFTYYQPYVDIINLPVKDALGVDIPYSVRLNKVGYTVGDQQAFQHVAALPLTAGTTSLYYNGSVPVKAAAFNVTLGWDVWQQGGFEEALGPWDLDLYLWLPTPGAPTYGQPSQFIVGYDGDAFGFIEADSYGTMNAFPYARLKREGGYLDGGPTVETITFANRTAHDGLAANVALPYWVGSFNVLATDYGQTIDHDNDGCGDNYGANYTSSPPACGGTPGIPLLGAYYTPYIYVWKDGVVKYFQNGADNFGPWDAEVEPAENTNNCNDHWWKAFAITSSTAGAAPTYPAYGTPTLPLCDDGASTNFIPYSGYVNQPNDRIVLFDK